MQAEPTHAADNHTGRGLMHAQPIHAADNHTGHGLMRMSLRRRGG